MPDLALVSRTAGAVGAHPREFADVGAGTEMSAGAGQDRQPHVPVGGKAAKGGGEITPGLQVMRCCLARAIDLTTATDCDGRLTAISDIEAPPASQYHYSPSCSASSGSPRTAEALSVSARCAAVLMISICEKACGKFPSSRPERGSYSSDRRPRSLRSASSRSNSPAAFVAPSSQH